MTRKHWRDGGSGRDHQRAVWAALGWDGVDEFNISDDDFPTADELLDWLRERGVSLVEALEIAVVEVAS